MRRFGGLNCTKRVSQPQGIFVPILTAAFLGFFIIILFVSGFLFLLFFFHIFFLAHTRFYFGNSSGDLPLCCCRCTAQAAAAAAAKEQVSQHLPFFCFYSKYCVYVMLARGELIL